MIVKSRLNYVPVYINNFLVIIAQYNKYICPAFLVLKSMYLIIKYIAYLLQRPDGTDFVSFTISS